MEPDGTRRKGGKKKGLPPAGWAEVRKAYEEELPPPSIAALSRRFGVKRETIAAHRDDPQQLGGAWVPNGQAIGHLSDPQRTAVFEASRNNVIDIATKKAIETATADGTLDAIAASVKSNVTQLAKLEELSLEFAIDTIERALGKKLKQLRAGVTTSEAGERKDAMTAAKMAIEMSRELRGKRSGVASISEDGSEEERRIDQAVLVVRAEKPA